MVAVVAAAVAAVEIVRVAVVREAVGVAVGAAGVNVDLGRPQLWAQQRMTHDNLLRMRSIAGIAFCRRGVSAGTQGASN